MSGATGQRPRRREVAGVLTVAGLGAALLLSAEPATGLVVVAAVGASLLVGPRSRTLLAGAVLLFGLGMVALGASRSDLRLGAGGGLVALAAGAAVILVRRWPPPRSGGRDVGLEAAREPTARDTWEALDRGEDPTV